MKEEYLHFIWKYNNRYFNGLSLVDTLEEVEIVDPGIANYNSGPDFLNAKVRIGSTIWAGNVEMHINASDWDAHGHQSDPAYSNVILHIVVNNNRQVAASDGKQLPTLVVKYPDDLERNYLKLAHSGLWIPCADHFSKHPERNVSAWLTSLLVDRLYMKSQRVIELVSQHGNNWEDATYIALARSFGLKVNAEPFEMLARATPQRILAKHRDSIFQLEAILFGQSGLLESIESFDEYSAKLKKEYAFLKQKYGLRPVEGFQWKFMRIRPSSFPTIRISQFASLIHKSFTLFSKIVEEEDLHEISRFFKVEASGYWSDHFTFGKLSKQTKKQLGSDTIQAICINTIVPFLFAYGNSRGIQALKDKALGYLEMLKPEKNSVVAGFNKLGLTASSAFESQAVVHLKTQYCDQARCLSCQLGVGYLVKKVEGVG